MLYISTREKYDAFTTARTLAADRSTDGGLYLPYRIPVLTGEELDAMAAQSFGQNVANSLNSFFGSRLNGWDVEFSIGRYPVKLVSMGQRIFCAECWRNLDGSYGQLERRLAGRILDASATAVNLTSWLRIAIRIALLTGIFGELRRQGMTEAVDIAVTDGDFSHVMALWYGRQMGLPIQHIVIGCGDGSDVWTLLHGGVLRCSTPELERLIYGCLGVKENLRLQKKLENGTPTTLEPCQREQLNAGLFTAVVSTSRMEAAIPNIYRTNAYILDPNGAVSYSALMDYRARTGESRPALILSDDCPADWAQVVAPALKMTAQNLKEKLR